MTQNIGGDMFGTADILSIYSHLNRVGVNHF